MTALPLILLMLFGQQASADSELAEHPQTYLASIIDLPLGQDEHLESFSIATWGVRFEAVCHIPSGWSVAAGGSLTPEGELSGEGGQGVTWFSKAGPPELENVVLVTLYGPVQKEDIFDSDGTGVVPATFKGTALIATLDGERKALLNADNIRLVAAGHCH